MTKPAATLAVLAELVGGQVIGDPGTVISGASPLAEVASNEITFIDQVERIPALNGSPAAAAIAPVGVAVDRLSTIEVADVHAAFTEVVLHFRPARAARAPAVSPAAHISDTAHIGERADIQTGVSIGDDVKIGANCRVLPGAQILAGCVIGDDVTIGAAAVLHEDTEIGHRCIIHSGVVIGSHGFGYSQVDGRHVPSPQLGRVVIGNDVEIGANSTIDRGTYGTTRIGDGTKIDNLVQIAHNCQIGRHNLLCSQVGIAGSSSTGDYVVMGGQAGVRDHVHIGTSVILSAKAGISNDVPDGAVMLGAPAAPLRDQKLRLAALGRLPKMRGEFKDLQKRVAKLERETGRSDTQHAA